jgi:hypothetical protein
MSKPPRHPTRVELPDVEPAHEHGRCSGTTFRSGIRLPCVSWLWGLVHQYGVVDNAGIPVVDNAGNPVISNH